MRFRVNFDPRPRGKFGEIRIQNFRNQDQTPEPISDQPIPTPFVRNHRTGTAGRLWRPIITVCRFSCFIANIDPAKFYGAFENRAENIENFIESIQIFLNTCA